jgi:hypothetical protein
VTATAGDSRTGDDDGARQGVSRGIYDGVGLSGRMDCDPAIAGAGRAAAEALLTSAR